LERRHGGGVDAAHQGEAVVELVERDVPESAVRAFAEVVDPLAAAEPLRLLEVGADVLWPPEIADLDLLRASRGVHSHRLVQDEKAQAGEGDGEEEGRDQPPGSVPQREITHQLALAAEGAHRDPGRHQEGRGGRLVAEIDREVGVEAEHVAEPPLALEGVGAVREVDHQDDRDDREEGGERDPQVGAREVAVEDHARTPRARRKRINPTPTAAMAITGAQEASHAGTTPRLPKVVKIFWMTK